MRNHGTYRHAWTTVLNAALLASAVFLAGIWAGVKFGRPVVARDAVELARGDAAQPQSRPAAAPVETVGVSHGARLSWNPRALPERAWQTAPIAPALNMRETPAGYDITVSLTGVDPRDLHIRWDQSLLIIQADMKDPKTERTVSTEGRLRIPADARIEATVAAFTNNHLHITIPRGVAKKN